MIYVPEIQVPVFAWNSQTMDVGEVLVPVVGLHACPGQCNGGYAWSNYAFTPNLVQPLSYFPVRDRGPFGEPHFHWLLRHGCSNLADHRWFGVHRYIPDHRLDRSNFI